MGRSRIASRLVARRQQQAPYDQQADFALGDVHTPMSAASAFLLARVVDDDTAARRRAHYRTILEDARESVPPPFRALPEGASPFGLPIEVDDRDEALRMLRARGIAATIFWCGSHPAIPVERFPTVRERRERTLLVPVHQELTEGDVDRVCAAVREVLRVARASGPGPRGVPAHA
jgi:dTDP-4-amino-4,6-dideoxygalactose transaminase